MSDDPRFQRLQSLQLRFCEAVSRGEWMDAATLQDERFALIDALLANPDLQTPEITGALRQIADSDRQMIPALAAVRDETAAQLRELRGARKAHDAYTHP